MNTDTRPVRTIIEEKVESILAQCRTLVSADALDDAGWLAIRDAIGVNIRAPGVARSVYELLSMGVRPDKIAHFLRMPPSVWRYGMTQPRALAAWDVAMGSLKR